MSFGGGESFVGPRGGGEVCEEGGEWWGEGEGGGPSKGSGGEGMVVAVGGEDVGFAGV